MSTTSNTSQKDHPPQKLLGDFQVRLPRFEGLDELFTSFRSQAFLTLSEHEKYHTVHGELCRRILAYPEPCFLLSAVIEYIQRVHQEGVLDAYSFAHFELWLNQFSSFSREENYLIRAKIAGRYVPRDAYQHVFPIGMDKVYPGSHYVTAHTSPDLDTTVASFWGWMDAFAARVSEGLHIWNLPGGPPRAQVEIDFLFDSLFGPSMFDHLCKTRSTLSLSGIDLMTQKGFIKSSPHISVLDIERDKSQSAVVVVDHEGYFLGDWCNTDVESVRQVVMLLASALRWFESHFHMGLITLFAEKELTKQNLLQFSKSLFDKKMKECDFAKHMSSRQQKLLDSYLVSVLELKEGLLSSFREFALRMQTLSIPSFQELIDLFISLSHSSLFEADGRVKEDRSMIFTQLAKMTAVVDKAIDDVRLYADRLGVSLEAKKGVFGFLPQVISYRAEVEEIRGKMGSYPYLTVTSSSKEGRPLPLGVIHAVDIHKPVLGTVTLRDFCNRDETKVPSYFEVISVIDHHKTSLTTMSVPSAIITDQQSSNAVVAQLSFEINAPFSLEGQDSDALKKQRQQALGSISSSQQKRLLQRVLHKEVVAETKGAYFVDPNREYVEYLHCLYAILDDTDLLSKVSAKDVHCVALLLNKMKSISMSSECEIIHFDDIPRNHSYVQECAKRILQNSDMHSLYSKIYSLKEESVEKSIRLCVKGEESSIFTDTKQQNGCCRVGQTKMFAKNFPSFLQHHSQIRALWYASAKEVNAERPEVDLHLHMISTIPGADEVYKGTSTHQHTHKDELWIWIPMHEQAVEHLKTFLSGFKQVLALQSGQLELEFLGDNAAELDAIFAESFLPVPRKQSAVAIPIPMAVLRFSAGILNSRKAMISPYLPKL